MNESKKLVPRTKWWQIALSVLFVAGLLLWLWAYLWNICHLRSLFLHHQMHCPIIPLPYYFLPVFGYPWLLHIIITLPYCLVLIAFTALILVWIIKITTFGIKENRLWKLLAVLLLTSLLCLLVFLGIIWAFFALPFLLIVVGVLYLYLRPPMKDLVVGLVFTACVCYFFTFSIFYLNEALDNSSPFVLHGKLAGVVNFDYFIVQPDSGGNTLGIEIIRRKNFDSGIKRILSHYHLAGRYYRSIYYSGYCLFICKNNIISQPGIEVYGVHRGLFGLKWQEKGAGYKLLPD